MKAPTTDYPDATIQAEAFMKASIEKNQSFMQKNLHDAFLFITPRGTLFTLESFLKDFLANPNFVIDQFELVNHTVFENEGLRILNGIIRIRFSGQEEQYERMTIVMITADGQWKLLNIQGTFTTRP